MKHTLFNECIDVIMHTLQMNKKFFLEMATKKARWTIITYEEL